MKSIEKYIEMLKLSPRQVSLKGLELLPDGIYRCYCSARVDRIENRIIISDNFKIKLEGIDLPIFENDRLVFRNFKKVGNEIIITGEVFVDRSYKRRVKIENGTIPILKGLLIKEGESMFLRTSKHRLPLTTDQNWETALKKNIKKYIVLRNVIYQNGRLILNNGSEVYLEK